MSFLLQGRPLNCHAGGFSKTGPKWVERGSLRSRRSRLWPFRAQMRCGGCASGTGTPGEGAIVGWGWGPRMAPMTSKLLQMLIFSFWFPLNATKLGNCSLQNQSHTQLFGFVESDPNWRFVFGFASTAFNTARKGVSSKKDTSILRVVAEAYHLAGQTLQGIFIMTSGLPTEAQPYWRGLARSHFRHNLKLTPCPSG